MSLREDLKKIEICKTSPQYLITNSTCHKWVFGAIAELIDNSKDAEATRINVDVEKINGHDCLVISDNGTGMHYDQLLKMLSLGYCGKSRCQKIQDKRIGKYGNGFKSGAMRIADDALVLTKYHNVEEVSENLMKYHGESSIGLLSQSFLKKVKSDAVITPIATFERDMKIKKENMIMNTMVPSLNAITEYSILNSMADIKAQFDTINRNGTKVILYNLRQGQYEKELELHKKEYDILLTELDKEEESVLVVPLFKYSLMTYLKILYLKPNLSIYIKGARVPLFNSMKCISDVEIFSYKPLKSKNSCYIVSGYPCVVANQHTGVMIYHKGRLIRPYEKLGGNQRSSSSGRDILSIVDASFLTVMPNKQEFAIDKVHSNFMSKLNWIIGQFLRLNKETDVYSNVLPDNISLQCHICYKWRKVNKSDKSVKDINEYLTCIKPWECNMNNDSVYGECDMPEENDDGDYMYQTFTTSERLQKSRNDENEKDTSMHADFGATSSSYKSPEKRPRRQEPLACESQWTMGGRTPARTPSKTPPLSSSSATPLAASTPVTSKPPSNKSFRSSVVDTVCSSPNAEVSCDEEREELTSANRRHLSDQSAIKRKLAKLNKKIRCSDNNGGCDQLDYDSDITESLRSIAKPPLRSTQAAIEITEASDDSDLEDNTAQVNQAMKKVEHYKKKLEKLRKNIKILIPATSNCKDLRQVDKTIKKLAKIKTKKGCVDLCDGPLAPSLQGSKFKESETHNVSDDSE